MTQIKRIRHSIHPLVQFQYLELISSFKFPPWVTIPYTVEINQKGIGIGLALFNSNQELIQESSWNIGTGQLVYNGELAGIAEGIKLVNKIV
ncbi:reverse transcriptase protein [Rutstroemia sp. NJR-2017a BBW]|nr:reverse transcriptase protein [Rutstroemia sp. NJR-2017a BBW]